MRLTRLPNRWWLPIVAGLPQSDALNKADSIAVLSFGRNAIPDRELSCARIGCRHRDSTECIQELIVNEFPPGFPNHFLVGECWRTTHRYGLTRSVTYLLQWEVAVAFELVFPGSIARLSREHRLEIIWPLPDRRSLTTTDVLCEMRDAMSMRGLHRPIILAHRWHMVRAGSIARHILPGEVIFPEQSVVGFDRRSVQPHTTARHRWIPYDTLARAHYLLHGVD